MERLSKIVDALWSFLTSLKLTIILLIILSIVCIVGTVIPQNAPPQNVLKIFSLSSYRWFLRLGLLDMYHAWWFVLLLTILTLNLLSCSINHFPSIWRALAQPRRRLDEETSKRAPFKRSFRVKKFTDETKLKWNDIVAHTLSKPTIEQDGAVLHLFSEKGRWTRLAFYLTHVGLIIIIVGGILGALGFQGYMQLTEGETSDEVLVRDSGTVKKLDFSVRCDNFEVTFYEDSNRPKDYKSMLTVIEDGIEVKKKIIEVNDPLAHKGIVFYQSSYGTSAQNGIVLVSATPVTGGWKKQTLRLPVGGSAEIEGTKYRVTAKRFVPDFSMDAQRKVISRSNQLRNPAVQLAVSQGEEPVYETWIFAQYPDFHGAGESDFQFRFLQFLGKEYTGLQVKEDPGVWTVWIGCILLTVGSFLAFFSSHRRIWLRLEERDGELVATLAGSANKNRPTFQRDFEALFQNLKKA